MRSCAWIGNSKLWITHVSMFLTILSMSDCLGMCLQIMNSGVSIDTSAWGVCVYSISGVQMVLTGFVSKSGCLCDILLWLYVLVLIVEDLVVITNIFLSLIWIYNLVWYTV